MIAALTIRPIAPRDVPALVGVLTRAYATAQNFELRLRSYLRSTDVATFIADVGGEPVGMLVGNDYGPMAYVAQMAVDPPFQRRGIATALMDALIAWTDARGFIAVELDATPPGAPLYARYGFGAAGETRVWGATTSGGSVGDVRPYRSSDAADVAALDARAFGADRGAVLRDLVDAAHNVVLVAAAGASAAGFAVAQQRAQILGPVVAGDPAVAERLIDAARLRLPALHRVSVPSENAAAQRILAARGYRLVRSLTHMLRGTRPASAREMLFARINLGQG